jgi:NADPH:quinone reductase-like Zn-dependent oxidoreductase
MAAQGWDFLVLRSDLHETKIAPVAVPDPGEGEVLFRVESFSLTANNVTYAVAGDQIGYWRFFPKPDGWGCIPAWGYGVVEASANPDFAPGERFYGYWPMASHLLATPRRSRTGFVDEAACRADLPPTYNQYVAAPADAPYQDHRSLLNPLFMTSFLIDDLLADNGDFGARTVILASASSRTSLGLAWLLKKAGRVKVVGLTSPRNKAFVEALGYYDQVALYDDLAAAPVETPAVFVDFAGDPAVRAAVHNRFKDDLAYSCLVGITHWEARSGLDELPGPKPVFFFAPDRVVKRRQDWGPGGLETRYAEAWEGFVADTPRWLTLTSASGSDAVKTAFHRVLEGRSPPSEGLICTP